MFPSIVQVHCQTLANMLDVVHSNAKLGRDVEIGTVIVIKCDVRVLLEKDVGVQSGILANDIHRSCQEGPVVMHFLPTHLIP